MTKSSTPSIIQRYMETLGQQAKKSGETVAARLLPARILREFHDYRAYERYERALYLKTRIRNSLGLGRSLPASSARSFLFVCFGNIMRSPMCEALMRQ